MGIFGDLWMADPVALVLRRYDTAGRFAMEVAHPGVVHEIVPTSQGTVILGSIHSAGPGSVWLHEYHPNGALLRSLDLLALFPPGVQAGPFSGMRVLVSSSGAVWVGLKWGGYRPLMRLNPNWTLAQALALNVDHLLPGQAEGVWVIGSPVPGQPAPLGLPIVGSACHVDATGVVVEAPQGTLLPSGSSAVQGFNANVAIRLDGTILFFTPPPEPRLHVHPGGHTTLPFAPPGLDITWPSLVQPNPSPSYGMAALYLDGRNRIWVSEADVSQGPTRKRWSRLPADPPHRPVAHVPLGDMPFSSGPARGHPTLHTYAMYTDPTGDLDGDGTPNRTELINGTNPFVASGPALGLTITYPSPTTGGWLTMDYTLPSEAGMPYFAPFAFTATRNVAAGTWVPIDLSVDPFVPYALTPPAWLLGTLGTVDGAGDLQVRLLVPPSVPAGTTIFSALATADAAFTGLRVVSAAHLATF
ncbi:MAG: hypothetical protein CMJ83_21810 [Planctomycetes bacterium]|nr:hypothetical protein [Planctomycetota bacterium]